MVHAVVLARVLNGNDIAQILNNTDKGGVAPVRAAYFAQIHVGNVETFLAVNYLPAQPLYGFRKAYYRFGFLFQKVQYEAERSFFSNAWQTGKFFYGCLQ
jgi:hypothetical protein